MLKKQFLFLKNLMVFILIFTVLLCSTCIHCFANADIVGISIPKIKQNTDNLCGAACAVSIISYYGTVISQSAFTKYVTDSTDEKLTMNEIKTGLANWQVNSTLKEAKISFSTVYSNINSGKPIIAGKRFLYQGHVVVLCGATISSNYITYMDPATGTIKSASYSDFQAGTLDSLPWAATLYSIYKA